MIKIKNRYIFTILILILTLPIIFIFKPKSDNSYIKIGILMPLTKSNAQLGIDTKNGIDMYVNEINNSGGINGKKIKCIEYDDEGDPGKAVNGYNYFKDQNVSAVITGMYSSTTLAVVEAGKDDSIPIMVTTASADAITGDNKSVYRVGSTNTFQGEKMADFAKMLNAKNTAVIYCSEDDYSLGLKNSFVNKCPSIGINVCDSENFSANSVDFQRQLENIKSKNPDLIFIPSYYEVVSLIVKQARDMGITCPLLGGDSWSGIVDATSNASSLNNCFYYSAFSVDDPRETSRNFTNNFLKSFNLKPTTFSACGYDAMKVLVSSIEKVLKQEIKINSDDFRKGIIDNLQYTEVDGVTGNIKFDERHNPQKQAIIVQIKDGKECFYQKI